MPPKTPPPKPPVTLETPISVRSTSGHSYDATLEASRKAVMADLHRIPIVNIDDMLTAMFPHVNPTFAHAVVEKLKQLAHINARGRWQAFDVEPSKQMGTEDSVYNKGVLDTFNQIITATKILVTDIDIPVPMALNVAGAKTPRSERTNTSRPDAYFHLKTSTIPGSKYRPDLTSLGGHRLPDGIQEG
ncbi:hypothetical protein BS47DRAFT_416383 [Hydnum rufescens UP504]|uniref:Uncharacterized protein n=1 Tax=Hydnum rufescens UP504 TaxID=1448309 RepID=A0A9P6E0R3_9AGAM|nr:hypothetical protein BS47DRAFT_416383 [Hydnum rufescens UP504]